ncbi:MAG TPA: thioredoxin domain-containing protein [Anaeromyxobacter sp.]|nr:thioredoxin domain-containing protein [Anaeromyxobacter sp.]
MRRRGYLGVLLPGVWLLSCGSPGGAAQSLIRVPVAGSPQRGPSDAWVTMVEYADFECPYCRSEEPTLVGLLGVYGPDLRLIFKYFPLAHLHPHAESAAVSAECADEQGKFWEMHDLLLTSALDNAALLEDASQVAGLDVGLWQACIGSPEAASVVDSDLAAGLQLGIGATPTLVINGVSVVGAASEASLRTVIDRERARAIASGIPRADYYEKAVLGQ